MDRRHFLRSTAILAASCSARHLSADDPAAESIDDILKTVHSEHDVPALAGAAIFKGRIIAGAVGVRKAGDATPVQRDDPFHIGSCTKSMTATLAGMLVEEGKLKWESTLVELLPALARQMQKDYRTVTLEQLLAHRAGFSTGGPADNLQLLKLASAGKSLRQQRSEFVASVLKDEPVHPPGSKYTYSNRSYITAGAIIERLTNTAWEDLMRMRIFQPLGMTTAGFGAAGTPGKIDAPWPHQKLRGTRVPIEPGPMSDNPAAAGPAGTVRCSAADWAKYLLEHVRGESGAGKLLKAETVQRLHTPPADDYAGGWIVTDRDWGGGKVLWHNGSNTMNYALTWLGPRRDFGALAITNQADATAQQACDQLVTRLIGRYLPSG